ncbi:Clp protease N-terminal domain-containing protein [Spirillospora sp. NPDC029432]|uniref:Clp protease N-terminal domain-containing protein n=1 Tax=Spirillospora sp. NPDC029432 TaxID=3154599 RepID=UPI003455B7E0
MFERFTDRSRHVIVLAQEESRLLGHDYIGTEHLLLGLIREDADQEAGEVTAALAPRGIGLAAVRAKIEEVVGEGAGGGEGEHVPFTPRAKVVLELGLREAQRFGHEGIDAGHLLLGLLREGKGLAARVLMDLGADLDELARAVVRALGGQGSALPPEFRYMPPPGRGPGPGLDAFAGRLEAIEERLDRIERAIARLADRLDPPSGGA